MTEKFHTDITADASQYEAEMNRAADAALTADQRMASGFRELQSQMANGMQQMNEQVKTSHTAVAQSTQSLFANMQKNVQGEIDKVMSGLTKMQALAAGAGALILSGGAFGAAVQKSSELTKEAQKLGRALGISATDASVLNVALGDIYQTSDTLLAANKALTRVLREDEQAVLDLGVKTRDANGHFRDSFSTLTDVNKKLSEFKEGTDRNIEGQKIYKKTWEEVSPLLKLNAELMEASKKKAESLNLVVGAENVEATAKYRAAMNDVQDVLTAVKKAIGDAVMPALTELGQWFAETGPERVEFMRKAMAVVVSAFYGLKMAVEIVWATVKAGVQGMVVLWLTLAEVASRALRFDFKGAKDAAARGLDQVKTVFGAAFDDIVKQAEGNREKIFAALYKGFEKPTVTATGKSAAASTSEGGKDKGKGERQMALWEAELAAQRDAFDRMKLEQGSFQQFTKAQERDFWGAKIALTVEGTKERAEVERKYYAVERDIRKDAFEAEVADIKGQMAAAETNAAAKIDLANKVYLLEVQRHGALSKQAKDALKEVQEATDAWSRQQREIRNLQADAERDYQLSRVALERQNLDLLEQLGIIKSKEKIARLKDLKEIEYAIEAKALTDRLTLMAEDPTTDPVKYQETLNRIRALKEKHVLDMAAIDGRALEEQRKNLDKWTDPFTQALGTMVNGVFQGTQTIGQLMGNLLKNTALAYAQTLLKMGIDWAKAEITKTMATTAGVQTRVAAEEAGAVESAAIGQTSAIATIATKAWEAAAGVYASIAAIPVVGPFLAPAMAVAAAGTVLGFAGRIFSAEGGYSIPSGTNPRVQLHEEEMVLPKDIANPLRDSLGGGGMGGDVHLHVHALDRKDVKRFMHENRRELGQAAKTLARETFPKKN